MALNTEDKILDIDLSETAKQRFRIDGDNDRIVLLNISDMGVVKRLTKIYPKLEKLANEASLEIPEDADDLQAMTLTGDKVEEIDQKMRALLNEIFDSDVDHACAPDGTMFDLFNGRFRFEIIIDRLGKLYGDNFNSELEKAKKHIKKHTGKYVK